MMILWLLKQSCSAWRMSRSSKSLFFLSPALSDIEDDGTVYFAIIFFLISLNPLSWQIFRFLIFLNKYILWGFFLGIHHQVLWLTALDSFLCCDWSHTGVSWPLPSPPNFLVQLKTVAKCFLRTSAWEVSFKIVLSGNVFSVLPSNLHWTPGFCGVWILGLKSFYLWTLKASIVFQQFGCQEVTCDSNFPGFPMWIFFKWSLFLHELFFVF